MLSVFFDSLSVFSDMLLLLSFSTNHFLTTILSLGISTNEKRCFLEKKYSNFIIGTGRKFSTLSKKNDEAISKTMIYINKVAEIYTDKIGGLSDEEERRMFLIMIHFINMSACSFNQCCIFNRQSNILV